MIPIARQAFPARVAALVDVLDFVDRCAARAELPAAPASKLRLIAEELFLNCVEHGYGGDCAAQVLLAVDGDSERVQLMVEDRARPFDPFAKIEAPSGSADPAQRPVGHLGVPLVARLAEACSYERADDCNRVRIRLACGR